MPAEPLSPRLSRWVRWGASALGIVGFVAGAVAVFVSDNGLGTVALLVVGAVLMLFPFFEHRIQGVEVGGTKLLLRAEEHQRRADAAERRGDMVTASQERARSRELLAPLAEEYRWTRRLMEPGAERARHLEDFMRRARRATSERSLRMEEVREWLRSENAETRVVGLAAMRERAEVRDLPALREAFDGASSAFEQNHSMGVMTEMAPDLTPEEREEVRRLVLWHRAETFGPSSQRWAVSERLLAALTDSDDTADTAVVRGS
ncbi:hypothetical protein [Nocardiopsis sp. L17-MgMaSL7]|uniref:hypothetical protein n=1 Tax=Nocardiopsis sp. L17-MgMaSL7 TaxID=1938893 RepID=UPI000D7120DE|nr:hypothetical protein [Nocardiopsis sp. L17-MgMaSL7]PWV44437.1 hypothetical protein BDW27_12536 [Nocardiopsis sp. L17-MgMaSL7]